MWRIACAVSSMLDAFLSLNNTQISDPRRLLSRRICEMRFQLLCSDNVAQTLRAPGLPFANSKMIFLVVTYFIDFR